jgi:hypothetical protein
MEIMKEWRQTPDSLEPVVGEGLYIRVIFGDAGADILHVDVLEEDAAHIMAAVAVGLDADALVGAFEMDALGLDVLGAARRFTADGQAVAVEEDTVGHGDVAAGIVRSR